ncbi:flagellar biosynthetic protein FliR [Crenobacter sp. SG2303]|uniref:Flagellar biosynthetic protein FliR n=1 Tax=Crenobacter oryzisoli TaxID=3056844 RepID=A0ABT7XK56_9NEIS|nr:flagellar biosynthetic protein FliR [Crenobacter sp. SG2303]MDN0074167.1 flagellar biosynthetic protein FliR [Crenobacter sp. SG2303]
MAVVTITDGQINALVSVFVWPFARIIGLFVTDPLFSTKSIPRRFKAGFALLLTLMLAPLLPSLPAVPLVSAQGVLILFQQLLIGITIGFVMRVVISAVEIAGSLMATQMGLGFAMFFDPQHAASVPVVSRLLTTFTFLLFLTFDGHRLVIETLLESFRSIPIGATLSLTDLKTLAEWGGQMVSWGLWLSLPVVGALLVTNLAIGVMTRAAPQFNIFSFGFPLTLLVGFIGMYVAVPLMVPAIETLYRDAFGFLDTLLKLT